MKKAILITFLAVWMFASVHAQTFTVTPSNTVNGTVYENSWVNLQIDFNNVSSADVNFDWELVSNTLDTNWSVTLCDFPSCFSYVPNSGSMDPISPGNYGMLKLTIGAGNTLGTGSVSFNVWDEASPNAKELVTFNVNAVVSIEDQMLEGAVTVYPNPAQDRVFIAHNFSTLEPGVVTLLDLNGAEILKETVNSTSNHALDISTLPTGMYLLRYQTENASMTEKVLKTF